MGACYSIAADYILVAKEALITYINHAKHSENLESFFYSRYSHYILRLLYYLPLSFYFRTFLAIFSKDLALPVNMS